VAEKHGQSGTGLLDGLRDHGYKITAPRARVLERLAGREDNFTAEELAAELAPVGRATVYRTLKLLVDKSLVCRVVMGDGSVAYRMSDQMHHHHLVCVGCGATRDIERCDVDEVVANVHAASGYEIVGHRIEVYGFCPDCIALQSRA
jgi:Fe2+ or Zn2+ uptake regulation protein